MISNTVVQQCCLYFTKFTRPETWKKIKWMNQKALPREAYNPTPVEHVANVITHGVWVIPSILATLKLLERSTKGAQTLSAIIYGATLIFLFAVSTFFHCSCFCTKHGYSSHMLDRNTNLFFANRNFGGACSQIKDVLHRCDRAMIYVFIAGSYFPWLTLEPLPSDGWASSMNWLVWFLALLGIIYQQTFHEKYKSLETVFYLIMGIVPGLLLIQEHDISGINELKLGGLLYVVGVMFFKSDGVIPCAHAIWHLFVVMAAGVHYFAILTYLFPLNTQIEM